MVRLSVISSQNGRLFWVFKQVPEDKPRKTDFPAEKAADHDRAAKLYNKGFFESMIMEDHISFHGVGDKIYVLVNDSIPIKGRVEGLMKIIQRKYHIKFATIADYEKCRDLQNLMITVGTVCSTPYCARTRIQPTKIKHSRSSAFKRYIPPVTRTFPFTNST